MVKKLKAAMLCCAALLAACGQDGERRGTVQSGGETALPGAAATTTETPATDSKISASQNGELVESSQAATVRQKHPSFSVADTPAAAVGAGLSGGGPRSAGALPVPDCPELLGSTLSEYTQPAAFGSLAQFLAAGLPAEQEFVVRPGRDTLLLGAQGTQLFVPAGSWLSTETEQQVRVRLREFYSLSDIFLAGLATTAGPQLLETGGMLNLTAGTAAGQPVALRPGAGFFLRLPTRTRKPEMQLFRGDSVGGDSPRLDWTAATALTRTAADDPALMAHRKQRSTGVGMLLASRPPRYLVGNGPLRRELAKPVRYAASSMATFRQARKLSAEEQQELKHCNEFARTNRVERTRRVAVVEFEVDTLGRTSNGRMRPGFDPQLAAPLVAAVGQLRKWRPARQQWPVPGGPGQKMKLQWRPVPAVGKAQVRITKSGRVLVECNWDGVASQRLQTAQQSAWEQAASAQKFADYRQRVAAQATQRPNAGADGQPAAPLTADSLFYELANAGLGWINCDRFLNSPQPLQTYRVAGVPADARAMLVLRGNRTMLAATHLAGQQVSFGLLPAGTRATVIAMRWQQGQANLATQSVEVGALSPPGELRYRPVTMPDLQAELAKLE